MADLGGLSGLGMYGGYLTAEGVGADVAKKKYENQIQQGGDAAFGRTLMMLNQNQPQSQGAMQGGMPQGMPPGPQPGMGSPMPQGQPPQGVPQPRPPVPQMQPGGPQGGMPQRPMGGPPMAPQGGGPPAAPGMSGPGMGQQQPQLNWQVVLQKVQQANPGAPPQIIAAAVDKFLPLMNQQSQMQWKELSLQLREQGLQNQRMLGEQRLQQGEERIQQGQQKIEQGERQLGERQREFDIREKRLEANSQIRADQGWQRLEQQKEAIAQRAQQTKDRNLISQWRAIVDAQHKRAMEIIQASSGFSALSPEDKKKLLADQEKNYGEAIEQIRNTYGSSTPSGGTTDRQKPKTQDAATKGTIIPGQAPPPPKPGDIIDNHRFKGGDPSKQENWEPVT